MPTGRLPRYFLDLHDGACFITDPVGREMDSPEAARDAAVALLAYLVRDHLPIADDCLLMSFVRDATGQTLYRATLLLRCTRLDPRQDPAGSGGSPAAAGERAPPGRPGATDRDPRDRWFAHRSWTRAAAGPMAPKRFRDVLSVLGWSQPGLPAILGCDDETVRHWAAGTRRIPPAVAEWLERLAALHASNPPPTVWRTSTEAPASAPGSQPDRRETT